MSWTWKAVVRDRRVFGWALFVLALLVLHGPVLAGNVIHALDPGVFNDDARQQIFPFFRFSDRELFRGDAYGDYFLSGTPIGVRALYTTAALIHDAAPLSKALPFFLLLVTVLAVVSAASAIGSRWSAFASASLMLGATLFMARMAGGLARGFAFPLLALGLAFLAAGRLLYLVALVPVAAAFYPPVAVLLGIASASAALLLPAADHGDLADWSVARRLALLAGAAMLTGLVVLPPVLALHGYGRMIAPAMVAEYPEAGPGGRYDAEDRAPFAALVPGSFDAATRALRPGGKPFAPHLAAWLRASGGGRLAAPRRAALQLVALVIGLVGGALLASRSAAARRILMLGIAVVVAHTAALLAVPYLYLPSRYLFYAVPLLVLVLLPAGAAEVAGLLPPSLRRRARPWAAAATALLLLVVFGGTGSASAGLHRFVRDGDRLVAAISGLPRSSMIAGWPDGPIENVPYVCRRRVLLSRELHQAFHEDLVVESRRRMRALIDAYLATSTEPVLRLREDLGVTHLIVDLSHFRGTPPTYFAPFDAWVTDALRRADDREFVVPRLVATHAIYAEGSYAILDLGGL